MWLDRVKQEKGEVLDVDWKSFSLDQVNSRHGPEWKVWEQPKGQQGRSLLSLISGKAALRQGKELFQRYHLALLEARHGGNGRIALDQAEPLADVARDARLDVERFREDMQDPELLRAVARDHTEAVEEHGVFGTPTFVFENGSAVFLKSFIPPPDDSVAFFEHFVALMSQRPYVGEIKRPQPPWPTGALR